MFPVSFYEKIGVRLAKHKRLLLILLAASVIVPILVFGPMALITYYFGDAQLALLLIVTAGMFAMPIFLSLHLCLMLMGYGLEENKNRGAFYKIWHFHMAIFSTCFLIALPIFFYFCWFNFLPLSIAGIFP